MKEVMVQEVQAFGENILMTKTLKLSIQREEYYLWQTEDLILMGHNFLSL